MRHLGAALVALLLVSIPALTVQAARTPTLEARVAALEARVTALENAWNPSPTPSPPPSLTPSATPTTTPTASVPSASLPATPTPTPVPSAPSATPSSCVGVANLATAIANAATGSTVWLSGTYTLTGLVTTGKSLTVAACPGGATITSSSSVRQDYLYFTGGPNVLRGVTFQAGSGLFHDSMGSALLECDGCHDLTVEDVTFVGHAIMDDHQQMFYQRYGSRVTCTRCTFTANGSKGFGVHQYPGSTTDPQMVVQDSYFTGFSASGAGVTTDSRITVRRSSFANSNLGIQLRNSAGGSILSDNIDLGGVTTRVQNPSLAAVNTWQ